MAEPIKSVAIPSSILANPRLSFTSKLCYGLLRYHQYDKTCCWPSIATLCKSMGGVSRSAVSRSVQQLKKTGLIVVESAHKQSNRYFVKKVQDKTWLCVRLDVIALPGVSAIDKLLTASLIYKSNNDDSHAYPHQDRLAAELGCSRSTIARALARLESANRIKVVHRGGGRKRGNYYTVKSGFSQPVLKHEPLKTVSKQGAKDKYFKELKRTGEKPKISFGDLSLANAHENRVRLLIRYGVHRTVADNITYNQQTPPESIENAVKNAIARKAWLKRTDRFRADQFNIAGYIVASLNTAREEVHIIKPSNRCLSIESLNRPYKPPSPSEFEKRKRGAIRKLLSA